MDRQSFEDGRTGRAFGPNTDVDSYRSGQRQADAGLYKPGWEGGGESKATSEPLIVAPKVEVDGAAFTLFLTSPLLFTVFPVWGLSLWVTGGGAFWLLSLTPFHIGIAVVGGLAGWFAAFFLGIRLEQVASQFAIYRMIRMVSRWVTPFLFVIWMSTSNGSLETMGQLVDRASGGTLFGGILAAILAHFVFRKADRIYFPVAKEVAKMEQLAARGESLKRGFGKRIVYALLWIVPVVALSNLTIRLVVGLVMNDADRLAFYARYSDFVILTSLTIWLLLSLVGILPGTGKVAMTNEKLRASTS